MNHIMLLLVLVSEAFASPASSGDDPATKAYYSAYNLVLDRKWGEAKIKFQELLKRYPKSKWAEEGQYWLCSAREKLGEPFDDVYACYAEFIDKYPDGKWAKQASLDLTKLSMKARFNRVWQSDATEVPYSFPRTTREEDEKISSLFSLQANDSAAALRETIQLYDSSAGETFRSKLVYVLGSFRRTGAVTKLGEIIHKDPSPMIRGDALALLANIRMPETYGILRNLLNPHVAPSIRQRALLALLQNDAPGVDTLCYRLGLEDPDEGMANLAAMSLSRRGGRVENKVFENLLLNGKHSGVRRAAFLTLAGLTHHAYSRIALKKISSADHDPIIRLCARKLAAMQADTLYCVQAIIDAMGYTAIGGPGSMVDFFTQGFDEYGFRSLLHYSTWSAQDEQVASNALQGLKRLLGKEGGLDYVMVALISRYVDVRKAALREIATAGATTPIALLDTVLHRDPDAGARFEALQALAVQANDSAAVALLQAARHDADASVRDAAVAALGRMHTPGAAEALKELGKQ